MRRVSLLDKNWAEQIVIDVASEIFLVFQKVVDESKEEGSNTKLAVEEFLIGYLSMLYLLTNVALKDKFLSAILQKIMTSANIILLFELYEVVKEDVSFQHKLLKLIENLLKITELNESIQCAAETLLISSYAPKSQLAMTFDQPFASFITQKVVQIQTNRSKDQYIGRYLIKLLLTLICSKE